MIKEMEEIQKYLKKAHGEVKPGIYAVPTKLFGIDVYQKVEITSLMYIKIIDYYWDKDLKNQAPIEAIEYLAMARYALARLLVFLFSGTIIAALLGLVWWLLNNPPS